MIDSADDLVRAVLAAVRSVPGLRPAAPLVGSDNSWMSWDLETTAVDVATDVVEVRLVALALPLPPALRQAERAVRAVLDGSTWRAARLRLVVTDVDASAVVEPA